MRNIAPVQLPRCQKPAQKVLFSSMPCHKPRCCSLHQVKSIRSYLFPRPPSTTFLAWSLSSAQSGVFKSHAYECLSIAAIHVGCFYFRCLTVICPIHPPDNQNSGFNIGRFVRRLAYFHSHNYCLSFSQNMNRSLVLSLRSMFQLCDQQNLPSNRVNNNRARFIQRPANQSPSCQSHRVSTLRFSFLSASVQ